MNVKTVELLRLLKRLCGSQMDINMQFVDKTRN